MARTLVWMCTAGLKGRPSGLKLIRGVIFFHPLFLTYDMNVFWNSDFYKKYKDVFDIRVFVERSELSATSTSSYLSDYYINPSHSPTIYSSTSYFTEELKFNDSWVEKDGLVYPLGLNGKRYDTSDVYMVVPKEVLDIFSDLVVFNSVTSGFTTWTSVQY